MRHTGRIERLSGCRGQLVDVDRRLWTVDYARPNGERASTVMAGVDESVVRYTMARYFPKVQVLSVTPAEATKETA